MAEAGTLCEDRRMAFVLRVIINGVAIWLTTLVLRPRFDVVLADPSTTWKRVVAFLVIGLVFGLVNAVVKPIVRLLSLPLYILTLGLFTLVVNALMLLLTGWLTRFTHWGLHIENFGIAIVAALIISVLSFIFSLIIGRRDRRRHA
jgi:putative membrane protein